MSIIHPAKRDYPFTVVPNNVLRDANLSLKAKGLLALVLSYPDNWPFRLDQITEHSVDSVHTHRAALKELEASGYARMNGKEWVVSATPIYQNATEPKFSATEIWPDRGSFDESPPTNTKKTANPAFDDDSWQLRGARWTMDRLEKLDALHPSVLRTKSREQALQSWADVLDKLHRIDGYALEDIKGTLIWLLRDDNWWIETRNFGSLDGVRASKRGARKFDTLYAKWKAEQAPKKKTEARYARDVNMRDRMRPGEFR